MNSTIKNLSGASLFMSAVMFACSAASTSACDSDGDEASNNGASGTHDGGADATVGATGNPANSPDCPAVRVTSGACSLPAALSCSYSQGCSNANLIACRDGQWTALSAWPAVSGCPKEIPVDRSPCLPQVPGCEVGLECAINCPLNGKMIAGARCSSIGVWIVDIFDASCAPVDAAASDSAVTDAGDGG